MCLYSLSHLSDSQLLRGLSELVAQDCRTTAGLLAHIAEVDSRKLYLPAAYQSMFAYCVHELRLSEEAAFKRIHAARTARRFPVIFDAVADGRLHLSAVIMLASHLTEDTADELLAKAARKTKAELEQLLANRFPKPDLPGQVLALAAPGIPESQAEHAPGRVDDNDGTSSCAMPPRRACGQLDAGPVESREPRPRVKPLSPQRFAIQVTIGQSTHDKLRYVQSLLSHQFPTGDLEQVLDRALGALVRELEKQKFSATDRPQREPRPSTNPRQVPAHVQRAVWRRDQGQCTFVGENGQRCSSRTRLEFDHIHEVARGGGVSVEGMRLRCRAHNQYTAECTFGTEFMERKRLDARRAAANARAARARKTVIAHAAEQPNSPVSRVSGVGAKT